MRYIKSKGGILTPGQYGSGIRMRQEENLTQDIVVPPEPVWTPADLNPQYWYDPADDYTTSSDSTVIDTWVKRAGSSAAVLSSQATASTKPTRGTDAGGRRVHNYVRDNAQMLAGDAVTWTIGTVFVVAKFTGATFSDYNGLVEANQGNNAYFVGDSGTGNWYVDSGKVFYLDGVQTNSAGLNSPHVYEMVMTGIFTESFGMRVGQDGVMPGRYWNGYIGDIISFTTILSAGDRTLVRDYLGTKWGITVS